MPSTVIDALLANAERHAAGFEPNTLTAAPARHLTVIACMDARLDLFALLGLAIGDAHIIRNAGGIATDDVVRSLTLSQRSLGTREVMVIQHTGCGLLDLDEEQLVADIEADSGSRPSFSFGSFHDSDANVRSSVERLRTCPFLVDRDDVRGFVYDVGNGRLREVT